MTRLLNSIKNKIFCWIVPTDTEVIQIGEIWGYHGSSIKTLMPIWKLKK